MLGSLGPIPRARVLELWADDPDKQPSALQRVQDLDLTASCLCFLIINKYIVLITKAGISQLSFSSLEVWGLLFRTCFGEPPSRWNYAMLHV